MLGFSRASQALRRSRLMQLLALGGWLEVWLLSLFYVSSLDNPNFISSPVVERWPVLLTPARWLWTPSARDGAFILEQDWPNLLLLALVFFGAFLISVAALYCARCIDRPAQRHLLLVLAGVLVFGLTMLLIPDFPSRDIFSYIFYGRVRVIHHANPLVVPPSHFPQDPFLARVWPYWRGTPSVYGPVWETLASGLTWLAELLGGSLATYVLLFKGVILCFHLANVLLIWRILGLIAPQRRLMGTILYAWNPLVLLEFAGSGHNDAVMLFFLLLAVLFLAQGSEFLALLAFAFSIDTKYITLLLIPIYLWYAVRHQSGWVAKTQGMLWRLAVLAGICLVLYLPYWAGMRTFDAVLTSAGVNDLRDSLEEVVATALRRGLWALGWPAQLGVEVARTLTKTIGSLIFLVCWLRLIPRARTWDRLLNSWWWAIFLYLVIACGWFLPWYVTWLLAVAALRPIDRLATAAQLLAGGTLIFYIMDALPSSPLHGIRAFLVFGPAIGYLLWWAYRDRMQTRHTPSGHPTSLWQDAAEKTRQNVSEVS